MKKKKEKTNKKVSNLVFNLSENKSFSFLIIFGNRIEGWHLICIIIILHVGKNFNTCQKFIFKVLIIVSEIKFSFESQNGPATH